MGLGGSQIPKSLAAPPGDQPAMRSQGEPQAGTLAATTLSEQACLAQSPPPEPNSPGQAAETRSKHAGSKPPPTAHPSPYRLLHAPRFRIPLVFLHRLLPPCLILSFLLIFPHKSAPGDAPPRPSGRPRPLARPNRSPGRRPLFTRPLPTPPAGENRRRRGEAEEGGQPGPGSLTPRRARARPSSRPFRSQTAPAAAGGSEEPATASRDGARAKPRPSPPEP